jgi:hypothetical protein
MEPKVWTAAELDGLTGAEREKLFNDSLVYDLAKAPSGLVARAQEFVLGRIANESSLS